MEKIKYTVKGINSTLCSSVKNLQRDLNRLAASHNIDIEKDVTYESKPESTNPPAVHGRSRRGSRQRKSLPKTTVDIVSTFYEEFTDEAIDL